jgi:hypothetical protein
MLLKANQPLGGACWGPHDSDMVGSSLDATAALRVRQRHAGVGLAHPWLLALVGVALLKSSLALAAAVTTHLGSAPVAPLATGFVVLQLMMFGATGTFLMMAHAHDARTFHLGAFLTVVSSAFSNSFVRESAATIPAVNVLVPLHPDAFLPVVFALFVREFPRIREQGATRLVSRCLIGVCVGAGAVLFLVNTWLGWTDGQVHAWREGLNVLRRRPVAGTVYWTTVFALVVTGALLSLCRLHRADRQDARRVRLFFLAFFLGLGPMALTNVLEVLLAYRQFLASSEAWWIEPFLQISLASLPVSVAYAVLVQQLLPIQWVIRKAIQYALARATLAAALVIPFGVLIVHGYQHRHSTLAEIAVGDARWLFGAVALAGFTLGVRESVLRVLDRVLFRERYDAREVLAGLIDQSRRTRHLDELVAVITAGIERALRPESVAVLVRDRTGLAFASVFGSNEPLARSSALAQILSSTGAPMMVESPGEGPLRLLPRNERHWLVDNRAQLLVPLLSSEGVLVGLILLGERKSELPYGRDDVLLLSGIANAGAMTIEHHAMRASLNNEPSESRWWVVSSAAGAVPPATECRACGLIRSRDQPVCSDCGGELGPADVPEQLFGKFAFEKRVGRGGMGVVYRARDLTLNRMVAVKTLPGTSPEHAHRLRREARAMAAVTHRHLAVVYGIESWHGKPLLMCEYMEQGTLADRLAAGPLPRGEALQLGVTLADVLQLIHHAGFLHRDLKPSNIGYAQGIAKLLDFGLVHMLADAVPSEEPAGPSERNRDASAVSRRTSVVGTLSYLSPEALEAAPPTPAFDLWSLNVLLLEAIMGRHPFLASSVDETIERIRSAEVAPAIHRQLAGERAISGYFERALAKRPDRRPPTATETRRLLIALQARSHGLATLAAISDEEKRPDGRPSNDDGVS